MCFIIIKNGETVGPRVYSPFYFDDYKPHEFIWYKLSFSVYELTRLKKLEVVSFFLGRKILKKSS